MKTIKELNKLINEIEENFKGLTNKLYRLELTEKFYQYKNLIEEELEEICEIRNIELEIIHGDFNRYHISDIEETEKMKLERLLNNIEEKIEEYKQLKNKKN